MFTPNVPIVARLISFTKDWIKAFLECQLLFSVKSKITSVGLGLRIFIFKKSAVPCNFRIREGIMLEGLKL